MYKNHWTKKIDNKKELEKKEKEIIKNYKKKKETFKQKEKKWEPDL